MSKLSSVLIFVLMLSFSTVLHAGDVVKGKQISTKCAMCHGKQGISINTMIPNLAGQKKGYLIKAMQDFKAKRRRNKIMDKLFKELNETDIQNLATFYSSL